jgi:hypothetical protein
LSKVDETASSTGLAISASSLRDSSRFSKRLAVERFWLPMINVMSSTSRIFSLHVEVLVVVGDQVDRATRRDEFLNGVCPGGVGEM